MAAAPHASRARASRALRAALNKARAPAGAPASSVTHTSMGEPTAGSFCMPEGSEAERAFLAAYAACVDAGAAVHVVERHSALGPCVVDIDLRHHGAARIYTRDHVLRFMDAFLTVLLNYVQAPSIDVVLLEKPAPRPDGGGAGAGAGAGEPVYKDGWHIVLPNVVTHPAVQKALRAEFLACARCAERIEPTSIPGLLNAPADVFDEAVIERNGWLMLGSRKPDEARAWEVTGWWRIDLGADDASGEELAHWRDARPSELAAQLSVRRPEGTGPTPYTPEGARAAEGRGDARPTAPRRTPAGENALGDAEFAAVAALVGRLGAPRADSRDGWMRVGWCLRNVEASTRSLRLWDAFSRTSSKHREGECEREWERMRDRGEGERRLGMGSLRRWVGEDAGASGATTSVANASAAQMLESINKEALVGSLREAMGGDVDADSIVVEPDGIRFEVADALGAKKGFVRKDGFVVEVDGAAVGRLFDKFEVDEDISFLHSSLPKDGKYGCTLVSDQKATLKGKPPHDSTSIDVRNMALKSKFFFVSTAGHRDERVAVATKVNALVGVIGRGITNHAEAAYGITNNTFIGAVNVGAINSGDDVLKCRDDSTLSELLFSEFPEAIARIRHTPDSKAGRFSNMYFCHPATNVWSPEANGVLEGYIVDLFSQLGDKMNRFERQHVRNCHGGGDLLHVVARRLSDKTFASHLDASLNIFALSESVVDSSGSTLDGKERPVLRPTRMDDMVKTTTGWAYDARLAALHRADVEAFLATVLPRPDERAVVLRFFASLLSGKRRARKLLMLTDRAGLAGSGSTAQSASGSNGKTTLMALMTAVFGQHASNNGKKFVVKPHFEPDRNSHDAGLEAMGSKRLVIAEEMKKKQVLDDGQLKRLTGGACVSIEGRAFGESRQFMFTWQAGIVLVFNDGDCPQFDPTDTAFMNRLIVAPMRAKFVPRGSESPDPADFEFPIVDDIADRFPSWRSAVIDVLLDHFDGNTATAFNDLPSGMRQWCNDIAAEGNPMSEWLEMVVEVTRDTRDWVSCKELHDRFDNDRIQKQNTGSDAACNVVGGYNIALIKAYFSRIPGVTFSKDIKVYPRGKVCTSSKDKKSMKNVHFGIKLRPEPEHGVTMVVPDTASPMELRFKAALELETGRAWTKVRPDWLRNPETGAPMELDMFCAEMPAAVEYNGRQHYEFPNSFHTTRAEFDAQLRRDKAKAELCRRRGVRLVVVDARADVNAEMGQWRTSIACA